MPYMTNIEDYEVFWVHAVPNSRGNIVEDYMGRMLGQGLWVFLGPLCKFSCTLVLAVGVYSYVLWKKFDFIVLRQSLNFSNFRCNV